MKSTSFTEMGAETSATTEDEQTSGRDAKRKEAEEALRDSEERHRLTTEALNGLLYDWNVARKMVTRSVGVKELIGYDTDEVGVNPAWWNARIHPEDKQRLRPFVRKEIARQAPAVETEYRVRHRDGQWIWVSDKARILYNERGKVRRIIGSTVDITERKQAEAALRESEARLRLATQTGKVGIWDWDILTNKIHWTDSLYIIYGLSPNKFEATVESFLPLIHPEDREFISRIVEAVLKGDSGNTYEAEFRVVRPDGRVIWLYNNAQVLREGSRPIRMLGATLDITHHKQTEIALRESEERFAKAFNASPFILTISSLETEKLIEVNETFVTLSGYSREEAIGRTTAELGVWSDSRDRAEELREVRQSGLVRNAEYRFRARTGREFVGLLSAENIEIAGEPCALTVIADITERKQAEEALIKSEERFARFMQHLPGLAWIKDLTGRYVFANKGARRLWRKNRAEFFGRLDEEIFPTEDAAHFRETDQSALTSETGLEFIEMTEFEDGLYHFLVRKFPIPGPDGTPSLIGGVAIDITERILAEEELREADRRKDEFLAILAHELRNPLAPIRTGLQVLRMAENDAEVAEQARTLMERQLQQMVRLIDELLDLSRISRGKIELRKEPVDISAVLRNALETSRPLIQASHHQLTVQLPPEPVFVEADLTRLAQVFANLLNNAAKYTDKGGHIQFSAAQQNGEVQVSVKDNGLGIPPEMLSRVFEMFTQVDRSLEKARGGLGIGLSIAKRLVEMHSGQIEAFSQGHGTGSEFVVRLPVFAHKQNSGHAETEAQTATPNRRRILVADDNEDATAALSIMLQLLGNEVRVANDGLRAIEIAEEFRPEMILLDIGMPGKNGYDVCRHIRQQPWGRSVLIAALTGWGQDEDKRRSQEAGFDHHLVKPIDPGELDKLLKELRK
ncbi:MAG TPA: PAS domain S-box protein [Blastocatellia bacterium]|nr:PAS domain S-box protein [Blastocatellia bacterium]HMY73749.1 PAS domain S-box protein [Blastocatellia bacterium]HMZ22037.1 PAS domain S-box protein [Blastocatellia bacterium]HNG31166.1 PAS domain S-box protein [Blastocatellia bacterium]